VAEGGKRPQETQGCFILEKITKNQDFFEAVCPNFSHLQITSKKARSPIWRKPPNYINMVY